MAHTQRSRKRIKGSRDQRSLRLQIQDCLKNKYIKRPVGRLLSGSRLVGPIEEAHKVRGLRQMPGRHTQKRHPSLSFTDTRPTTDVKFRGVTCRPCFILKVRERLSGGVKYSRSSSNHSWLSFKSERLLRPQPGRSPAHPLRTVTHRSRWTCL